MTQYVIVDLEATCGWIGEDRPNEIIEIGAVKLDENLRKVDEFQEFIRPQLNPELTEFCKKLTTITQAEVDSASDAADVITRFARWCGVSSTNKPSVPFWLASWGHYDKNQLIKDCERWSLRTDWLNQHISIKHQHGTMLAADMRAKLEQEGVDQARIKEQTFKVKKGIGMATALQMLNLPMTGTHHRGIDDARNITNIFIDLFPRLKFESRG